MFRLSVNLPLIAGLLVGGNACGQNRNLVRQDGQNSVDAGSVDPALWTLLSDWAGSSSQIKRLEGEHVRRVYDTLFKTEKISDGRFYYVSPDKGRIDVTPVPVNQKMLAARNAKGAKVRRDPETGRPFQLQAEEAQRWICDGLRVYDIKDGDKTAKVVQLPPNLQGVNIMNSPLPFLFGLPPEQAVKRFTLSLSQPFAQGDKIAYLHAEPKLRQDGENWKSADVILDAADFLPLHVRLINPAGTQETVYSFTNMKKNSFRPPTWWPGSNVFDPNLRGYDVDVIQSGDQLARPAAILPSLKGMPFAQAIDRLVELGIPKDNIRQLRGGPAPSAIDKFRIREQKPDAGTRITPELQVQIYIYESPRVAARPPQGP